MRMGSYKSPRYARMARSQVLTLNHSAYRRRQAVFPFSSAFPVRTYFSNSFDLLAAMMIFSQARVWATRLVFYSRNSRSLSPERGVTAMWAQKFDDASC